MKFPKKTVIWIVNTNKTFEKHPSVLKIKELNSSCRFSFENVSPEDVKKVARELDISEISNTYIFQQRPLSRNLTFFLNFFCQYHSFYLRKYLSEAVKIGRCKTSFQKKAHVPIRKTTGQLALCLIYD